jgi:uncharacterized protein
MGYANFIMKATRLCNLRCSYCNDWRSGPGQTMSFEVLARSIALALSSPGHDRVLFDWHGGEPTVLPRSFYERALFLQARFRRPGQPVANTVQTNATLVDDEWASFFARHDFVVGVSIDGPPDVHDRYRRDVDGRATFARVSAGIALLRARKVRFSVICVIDRASLERGPDAIFDFFLEQGINHYALNFVMPAADPDAAAGTHVEHYVTPDEMCAFLIGLYDRWRHHGDERIQIRELNALRRAVAGEYPGPCTFSGGCFGTVFRIEPNGDVHHCDYFGDDPRYRWGNVLESDFATMRRGVALLDVKAQNRAALTRLATCPEYRYCRGWCPHARYTSARHDPDHSDDCCGLRPLIEHLRAEEPVQERGLPVQLRARG